MKNSARSGSLSSLRQSNIGQVLSVLQQFGGMTQIELADAANLSTATISSIVRELTAKHMVETKSVSRNNRHAMYVALAQEGGIAAGVSIGRLDLHIELGDTSGRVLCERHMPLSLRHKPDTTVIRALGMLKEMIEMVGAQMENLRQITVALPAPVVSRAEVNVPEILPGWKGYEIAERFRKGCGVTPTIQNNANMACVAQVKALELNDTDALYVHADYEIGGALYINGGLYKGHFGLAGELGHVQVDANGAVCMCGRRGCLNTVASAMHLAELLRPARGEVSLRDIISDARDGDLVCMRLLEDAAVRIASAVEPVLTTFDCGTVIVGGKMTQVGDGFMVAFGQALRKIMFPVAIDRNIVLGPCGDEAVAHGAMLDASERVIMER
jgi:predicted NBD/HSP70 family sugar kinase/predicted transcriptional regulator